MIGFDNIEYASLTDVGVRRSHNQDAHALMPANDLEQWRGRGHVFMVADGMGAHAVGELASKLAADSIPHIYSKHAHEGPLAALRKAFIETNLHIHTRGQQNREFEGMGTTATAILLRPEGAWIGHVGDSRAYRIRNGRIEQLSFDHSLVWELARRQRKNPEDLQGIPSNVIIRSLGPEPLVQVDVEGPHPLRPGDFFILCSDGLSGPVTDREMGAVVSVLPPAEACRFLVNLANLQGGPDNITAVVVRIGDPPAGQEFEPDAAGDGATAARGPSLFKRLVRLVPWPILSIVAGIGLAILAIYLTFNELPGGVPSFLLAAGLLLGGVASLAMDLARERRQHDEIPEPPPRLKVYRHTSCVIDKQFVQRMAEAVASLEQRIRERHWEADWHTCHEHLQTADRFLEKGKVVEAFRAKCRAMETLMEAVQRQRVREEVFKPLWDQVRD